MIQSLKQPRFLPMTGAEMRQLGWSEIDVLLVCGDAYIDHPSFAMALLGRWLVHCGYRVGLVCQPRWTTIEDIKALGRPRLCAGVTAGALDSMVAHYTAFRKKRHTDAYTPGGECGHRPNRATMVYTNLLKQAFPGLPIVLGGLEASLRRAVHYDFWSDALRRPLLFDAKADILVYGMGERALSTIADRLAQSQRNDSAEATADLLRDIPGTAIISKELPAEYEQLASYEDMQQKAALLMDTTLRIERQVHKKGPYLVQDVGERHLIINPPSPALSTAEFDTLYALPYQRIAHPSYQLAIPAQEMIQFSITTHRGCGGGCSFCSLALHQGRRITSRSRESILAEAQELANHPQFKGSISDVGGPSANMWRCACSNPNPCRRVSCLVPEVCPFFSDKQNDYVQLLRTIQKTTGVKHLRIASGIRHDWALHNRSALEAYVSEFTGGQLKIAPEHSEPDVLRLMRKPQMDKFEAFLQCFYERSQRCGKEQYVIPYLLSAFPGCTDSAMRRTADWLRARHWKPQQVQCFIPTPGTVATAMYYCGLSPEGTPIKVARTDAERLRQHAILMPTSDAVTERRHPQSVARSRQSRPEQHQNQGTQRQNRSRAQRSNNTTQRSNKGTQRSSAEMRRSRSPRRHS